MSRHSLWLVCLLAFGACSDASAPVAPATHSAALLGDASDPFLVTAPTVATKTLAANTSHHYRVTVTAAQSGLRIPVTCSQSCSVYLRRTSATASPVTSSSNLLLHTLFRTTAETTADDLWFIEVHANAQAVDYTLRIDDKYARPITWDAGTQATPTSALAQPDTTGGDYLYTLSTQLSSWGAWRTVLVVDSGEASLFVQQGASVPPDYATYRSQKTGSDATVLASNEFAAAQTWTIRVNATPGATWRLFTGDVYITNLGTLAADATSSGNLTIGPEGVAWARTSVPAGALAWRLQAPSGTTLFVNDNTAPIPGKTQTYDLTRASQLIVVPDYLTSGQYLVAVQSAAASVALDSRQQQIRQPATQPGFSGTGFAFTLNGTDDSGFGYLTYQVDVPLDQIAWEVSTDSLSGDVDVYVRRGKVPAEYDNSGMSEVAGSVSDSVVQVPPTLTNGPWYVTVRGTPPFSFKLHSGNPEITDISYVNDPTLVPNGAAHVNQVGWRYYRVRDIPEQNGTLGWILELQDQVPGTEIAVRRNGVPGRWYYRQRQYTQTFDEQQLDGSSTTGFLERPNHPPDVWYVGIHQHTQALGAFSLRTRQLVPDTLDINSGDIAVTSQPTGRWHWFKVTVPPSLLGWDLALTNITSGAPKMVIRQDLVPGTFQDIPSNSSSQTSWPSGNQWAPSTDITGRPYAPYIVNQSSTDEQGRRVQLSMGGPIGPSVYYVGVSDVYTTAVGQPMTYHIKSRGIGQGNAPGGQPWAIQVADLAFAGGVATATNVPAREVSYYKIDVPAGSDSVALGLEPTAGEAMMAVQYGKLPNSNSYIYGGSDDSDAVGAKRQRNGRDWFYKYPTGTDQVVRSGPLYVAVASEGTTPFSTSYIGTGTSSFELTSTGKLPVTTGALETGTPLTFAGQTARYGEHKAYRFTVPASGVSSMELRLKNVTGKPYLQLSKLPNLFPYVTESYQATEGGSGDVGRIDPSQTLTIAAPSGTYTALVTTQSGPSSQENDATFDLEIVARGEDSIAFNGGTATVVDQSPQTWRYYRVVVPEGALGWDLRLANVQSGTPRMAIRRDDIPSTLNTTCCYTYNNSTWATGNTWAPDTDITQRPYTPYVVNQNPTNESGRIVQMGMNAPLVPGIYYVGVIDSTSSSTGSPMSYTLVSRGIGIGNDGDGTPWAIQVADIGLQEDKTVTNLPARDVAYFRMTIPKDTPSFHLELETTSGEAMLAMADGHLPNSTAYIYNTLRSVSGTRRQKNGREYFYWYPDHNQQNVALDGPLTIYIAVVSEGQNPYSTSYIGTGASTFTLHTQGTVSSLTAAAPLTPASPVTWTAQTLRYGEHRTYHLTVPAGTLGMEVSLVKRAGNPYAALAKGAAVPFVSPSQSYIASQGGWNASQNTNTQVTIAQPAGNWTITVASYAGSGEVDADYDLQVKALAEEVLDFNGGSSTISAQPATSWQYFRVTVPPESSGVLGWDLRLVDVTAGQPRMVVRRDTNPDQLNTTCCYTYNANTWATNAQWAPDTDATARPYAPYVPNVNVEYQYGRVMVAGMNAPLVPGTYVVGVLGSGTDPMSYRLVSRGIGQGKNAGAEDWAIQVTDVPWDGELTVQNLAPRESAYVRVVVPEAVEALGFTLETIDGEAMMSVRKDKLPNSVPYVYASGDDINGSTPIRRQKNGNEYDYHYAAGGTQATIAPGTWYFALTSEGRDPYSTSYIGTGTSTFRFKSLGRILPVGGIDKIVQPGQPVRFDAQALRYGEQRIYRFRVAADVPAYEIRLENRVGSPSFSAQTTSFFKTVIPTPATQSYIASVGGASYIAYNDIAETIVDRTGDVSVVVTANRDQNVERDAQFDLVVRPRTVDPLAWRGGTVDLSLLTKETRFFRVDVPNDCDGVPLAGWLVTADNTSGSYTIRARQDSLPGAPTGSATFQATESQVVVAPPYFGPGTWYVSVESTNLANVTLRSEEISELQHWDMPANGDEPSAPGVPPPYFGDSGVSPDGTPLNAGDRGRDLGQGRYHFYRVTIPPGNRGMLATYLEALSGNPDLYIRRGAAPTRNHNSSGGGGTLYNWYDTLLNTSYGHLVANTTREGYELAPGEWWLAVFAPSSNVRYRLKVSLGDIQDIAFDGGLVQGATLAGGDMRHYRVHTPQSSTTLAQSMPTTWNLRLLQQQGDVVVFVREWIPSGQNSFNLTPSQVGSTSYWSDWQADRYNYWGTNAMPTPVLDNSGTTTLNVGPLMPDTDYIVSVYARTQAVYDLESTPGAGRMALDGIVDFYDGTVDTTLAPNEKRVYRIDVPADAARWKQTAVIGTSVWMSLQLGTLPPASGADRTNSGNNQSYATDWDIPLYSNGTYQYAYPFLPNRSYYLLVENRNTTAQGFELTMDGRDKTDDSDNDTLPDWWEYDYFGSLGYTATTDYDNDQLTAAQEYTLGTNPTLADTDGDGLYDGLEVALGSNPLDDNSDGDLACDGDDSAPNDPNDSGEVIRLTMHHYTDGSFGNGHGSNRHNKILRAVFRKDQSARQHWLHFKGFDIEDAHEVGIYLNGELVSYLPVGANNQSSTPFLVWVDSDKLRTGDNFVELRKATGGDVQWGVDDLGLFTYGDAFGYDSTRAYDTRHPSGLRIHWLTPQAGLFELRAFDIESEDELTVDVDGARWLALPTSADLQWTRYFQVPLGTIDLAATPIPARMMEVTHHAGDGDWELQIVDRRDSITQTFGYGGVQGVDQHALTGAAVLFPVKPANREIKVIYQAYPEGSEMHLGGTNVDLYPSVWAASQNYIQQEILLCSLADEIDTSTFDYVPGEGTSKSWNMRINYYGVALDSDNDTHDDCVDRFPRNAAEWDDVDGDRIGDNWERTWFHGLTPATATSDTDGDGASDLAEFLAGTDPVCADNDHDTVNGANPFCATGLDCNDNDPEIGAATNDADCDFVPTDLDCDDSDPTVTTTNEGDADCDGVPTALDCNDSDAGVITTSAADADCDGVPTASDCDDTNPDIGATVPGDGDCDGVPATIDCDDHDPSVMTTNVGDADCDGVPSATDCDDHAPGVTRTNVGDADCDGVPTGSDCDDSNASVTTSTVGDADCDGVSSASDCNDHDAGVTTTNAGDADCDGVPSALDCNDNNPLVLVTNVGDADCDGVPSALDCDDNSAADGRVRDANDADCDGLPSPIDCNDNDKNDTRSRVHDADCDGVDKAVDCDDQSAAITRTNVGDHDCDDVPTAVDCNDNDANDTRSRAGDADCDGSPTASDCDDNDPAVQACPSCVDMDEDGHYAQSETCKEGDDCDDADGASTWREVDSDCDGARTDDDCDDEDPDSGVTADDKDCDGVATADDCDDEDSLAGPRATDGDCDGVPDATDNCLSIPNPDQSDTDGDDTGDACESCIGDDSDGDSVADVCDVCPEVPDDQADTDGDGTGDACEDGDGDGILDSVDVCPAVSDPDQLDSDRDGIGDACDAKVVTKSKEDGSCGAGGGAVVWLMFGVMLVVRRRGVLLAAILAMVVSGCGDGPKRRALGSTCDLDGDCSSGLCMEGQCFDPESDEDHDSLINVIEVGVGTDPFQPDSDRDLKLDADELGPNGTPKDLDGDQLIDAIESALADQDHDCIDDEHDATNTIANAPTPPAITAVCPALGVCGASGAKLSVTCPVSPTAPVCDFRAVPGYEAVETACDLQDNDCDGQTDEGCDALEIALLGHWKLDGDGLDSGPYGDDGQVVGATAVPDRFGNAASALRFVADGDHVGVPITHHPLGSGDITYTAWVKPDEALGDAGVVSFGELAAHRRGALVLSGDHHCASYVGDDNDAASATACAPPAHWSLLAVVKTGRTLRFYLDARLQGEETLAADQDLRRTVLSIGVSRVFVDGSARDQFHGAIDDVRLYGRALSEAELGTMFGEGAWAFTGTIANPARSCLHVRDAGRPDGDHTYRLDPDGDGPSAAFDGYCDMTTDGGGWTLAWVYHFTDAGQFTAASNAVTPIPSWPAALADVTISTAAPSGPSVLGAIDWSQWDALGTSFMVASDLADTLACDAEDGSFATGVEGPVACRVVADTTAACDGALPDWVFFWDYGPGLSAENLFYYFDGSTTDNWPTHDPCGTNTAPTTVGATAGGSLYLR